MGKGPVNIILVGFIVCAFAFSSSCAVNPVSGERELMLLSEEDEAKLGSKTDKEIVKQYGLYEDKELTPYVSGLGQKLAKVSHRPNLDYKFKVMDSAVVNAFAVPGGYVYLTRGILASLNNEAELAGVLGHELGHITARHSAKQYSRAQVAQIGLGLGSILSEAFRNYAGVLQAGVGMLFLSFSRDNEREADDLGVEYSSKVGYDSSQMAEFFKTLERMNPGSHQSGLPGWFSTHPNPADRQGAVKRKTIEWQQKLALKSPKVEQKPFLNKIDGMVYGDDPRQGYVEDDIFYHPMLLFQFPVPTGWKVQNTPTLVNMISKNKDAVIQLRLSSDRSPRDEAQRFVDSTRASVLQSGGTSVSGFQAYRVVSQIKTNDGVLQVMSLFIDKDKRTYVFHGYSSQKRFGDYRNTFSDTITGFRTPSDPAKMRRKPDVIKILYAKKPATVRQALKGFGVKDGDLKKMAIMNGKDLNDKVSGGTPFKTIVEGDR
ncbi:M48 family metalloprotease [Thermodesulfobacteriota bacterium]